MHGCAERIPGHAQAHFVSRSLLASDPRHDACNNSTQLWNSGTSEEGRRGVLAELASAEPELRLLYTTPESLRNPTLRAYLKVSQLRSGMMA